MRMLLLQQLICALNGQTETGYRFPGSYQFDCVLSHRDDVSFGLVPARLIRCMRLCIFVCMN